MDRLASPDRIDELIQITRPLTWLALATLLGLILLAALWSLVFDASIKVHGNGILISPSGILEIRAGHAGRITRIDLNAGQALEPNELIARLQQADLERELINARAEQLEAQDERDQLAAFTAAESESREIFVDQRQRALGERIDALQARLKVVSRLETEMAELYRKGVVDKQSYLSAQLVTLQTQDGLSVARDELLELGLDYQQKSASSRRNLLKQDLLISSLQRRRLTLESSLRRASEILSPYRGTVLEVHVNEGDLLQIGDSICTLQPEAGASSAVTDDPALEPTMLAIFYVAAEDGKKIQPGMEALVSPSTVRPEEYGYVKGRVLQVSAVPATTTGMMRVLKNEQLVERLSGDGAPIEVRIGLYVDPATPSGLIWTSHPGPALKVTGGTLSKGYVRVRKTRLIALLIPALQRFFESDAEST